MVQVARRYSKPEKQNIESRLIGTHIEDSNPNPFEGGTNMYLRRIGLSNPLINTIFEAYGRRAVQWASRLTVLVNAYNINLYNGPDADQKLLGYLLRSMKIVGVQTIEDLVLKGSLDPRSSLYIPREH